jgi:hypothetical protein
MDGNLEYILMLPENFQKYYKSLIEAYNELVGAPSDLYKRELITKFKREYNLSDNQINLLEQEPPF